MSKKFPRRPYQDRIITQASDLFKGDQISSVMVESATGSGKTFMGLNIAGELHEKHEDLLVVWVAMRRFLLGQVVEEKSKFGLDHLDLRPLSMFDTRGREFLGREIVKDNRPTLLVIDEAQHDAATTMTDVYQAVKPDWILGLSATPFRVDKAKLCFEKQIRDAGIHRLISDGFLSKFHLHMLEKWTPETVANAYLEDPKKWGKSVFYWLNQDLAAECTQRLIAGGCRTHLVVGGQAKTTDAQIMDFRENRVDALVNCMVLTEGFDCPELQTAWVRDSSRGPTMQMAGRAFRRHPDPTVTHKNIVQSQGTKWTITKTAMPEEQYIQKDDGWLSLKPNKRMDEISIAAIRRTIENHQPLPDFLTKGKKGKPVDQDTSWWDR